MRQEVTFLSESWIHRETKWGRLAEKWNTCLLPVSIIFAVFSVCICLSSPSFLHHPWSLIYLYPLSTLPKNTFNNICSPNDYIHTALYMYGYNPLLSPFLDHSLLSLKNQACLCSKLAKACQHIFMSTTDVWTTWFFHRNGPLFSYSPS